MKSKSSKRKVRKLEEVKTHTPASSKESQLEDADMDLIRHQDAVKHLLATDVQEVIKLFTFRMFPKQELIDSCISGKQTIKSTTARPSLDCVKCTTLETLIRQKYPSVLHKIFVGKNPKPSEGVEETRQKRCLNKFVV